MSVIQKQFQFENVNFKCCALITADNRIFCKLKELSDLLEYQDLGKAYKLIDDQYKFTWSRLVELEGISCSHPYSNWQPNTIFIAEPGIYSLAFRSKKPEAKRFRDHVFKVVLPTIRKEGGYVSPNITDSQADNLIKSLEKQLAENKKLLTETQKMLDEKDRTLTETQEALTETRGELIETREKLTETQGIVEETQEILAQKNTMLAQEMQQKHQLQNKIRTVRPKVAVIPDRDWFRHTLRVYKGGNQYICIRVQKRGLEQAVRRIPAGFQLVFSVDDVPNALNIVNRLRERLPNVRFRYNKIFSNADIVEAIRECLEEEINRPIVYNHAIH